jgi:hypothetical protein
MFPRFAHLTSRLFDQSTRLLPAAACQLYSDSRAGSLSEFAIGSRPVVGCLLPPVFRFPGWIAVGIRYRKSPRGGSLEQMNADSRVRIGVSISIFLVLEEATLRFAAQ